MENKVNFITSEKGKPLVLLNLHKYRFIRERKDGIKKWLCTKKSCYASILTNGEYVHETINEHHHPENSQQSIERQVLREACKRKSNNTICVRPIKIIRNELMGSNGNHSEIEHRDVRSIRKAMYDKRRKNYPAFPKSLRESIEQLKAMEDDDIIQFQGKQFVFIPDNKLFVCVTTEQNLTFMTSTSEFFADGTFNYAPKFFAQLYTINCFKNGFYVPVAYFLLPNKSKQIYADMWLFLQELCEQIIFKKLLVLKLHLDFEIGAHEAAKEVFPNIEIDACRFHLGQSWWRKVSLLN